MTIIYRWNFISVLTLTACLAFGADTTPSLDIPALVKKAESGDALAQFSLGTRYYNGAGVPKDPVLAVSWYRKAAEQGNASAQWLLGFNYSLGEGVPKDDVLAYFWYNLSAAQGHQHATDARDIISKYMTSAQIAEAQRMTQEWKPTKASASP